MENMTWEDYKQQHQLKRRSSKKAKKEHEQAIFVAWQNLYKIPQDGLLKQANDILTTPNK